MVHRSQTPQTHIHKHFSDIYGIQNLPICRMSWMAECLEPLKEDKPISSHYCHYYAQGEG